MTRSSVPTRLSRRRGSEDEYVSGWTDTLVHSGEKERMRLLLAQRVHEKLGPVDELMSCEAPERSFTSGNISQQHHSCISYCVYNFIKAAANNYFGHLFWISAAGLACTPRAQQTRKTTHSLTRWRKNSCAKGDDHCSKTETLNSDLVAAGR